METDWFCANIRFLRKANNLSQEQMAKIMGIGVKSLRKIEKGKIPARIGASTLNRICDAFEISADRLLFSLLVDTEIN